MWKWNLLLNPVNNLEILSESLFGISVRKVTITEDFSQSNLVMKCMQNKRKVNPKTWLNTMWGNLLSSQDWPRACSLELHSVLGKIKITRLIPVEGDSNEQQKCFGGRKHFFPKTHHPGLTMRKTSDKWGIFYLMSTPRNCQGHEKPWKSEKLSYTKGGRRDRTIKCNMGSWMGSWYIKMDFR